MNIVQALLRPLSIPLIFACGYWLQEAHEYRFLIRWLLMAMLYVSCLQLAPAHLQIRQSHWRLLAANVLMALLPWWGFTLLGLPKDMALAAFFIGIAPTATATPVIVGFLRGQVGYAVTAFILTNTAVALLLLGLLPLVTGNDSLAYAAVVLKNILLVIVLPITLSLLTRRLHPSAVRWPGRFRNYTFGLWLLTLFLVAASASQALQNTPGLSAALLWQIAVYSLIVCITNFVLGYLLGEKELRREASQSLGQKNTGFTIYMALSCANPVVALGPTCYVLWHNLWNAAQMLRQDLRKRKSG